MRKFLRLTNKTRAIKKAHIMHKKSTAANEIYIRRLDL